MKKLLSFLSILLLSSTVFAASLPENTKPEDLRIYGDKKPTTVYLFSSLTCPHCAVFHKEIMPQLLSEYVDAGKIQLIYVEMPYDAAAMTGSMLSRCVDPEHYEQFMQVMFENQATWAGAKNAREIMTNYAKLLGLSKEKADACLANVDLRKTILKQRTNLSKLYSVRSMPSVVIVKDNQHKLIIGTDKDAIFEAIDQRI